MFLRNVGASGRFTFDVIYSCLQKSMRRNDYALALEMVKEFKDYPNALKKRLIYDCCEDCPNLYLINAIYNTKPEMTKLAPFVKIICEHIKCREVILGFRVACQTPKLDPNEDFEDADDMFKWCQRLFSKLCVTNGDCDSLIKYFITKYPQLKEMKLSQIYNFINKNRLALYAVIAFFKIPYITKQDYGVYTPISTFDFTFDPKLVLPKYVYDKHVRSSPPEQKSYKFFIENIVLSPRMPKTKLEMEGERLYITTNQASGEFIKPDTPNSVAPTGSTKLRTKTKSTSKPANEGKVDDPLTATSINQLKLLQVQLITAKHKPRVWFCNDRYVLKGPMTSEQCEQLELSDKLKALFQLKTVNYRRLTLDGKLYLLSDCLYDVDYNNFIVKSSKLESNVNIYNGPIHGIDNSSIKSYLPHIQLDLLKNLAFRKLIGTNDTCERNIIIDPKLNFVASIDDPVLLTDTPFIFKKQITNKPLKTAYQNMIKEFGAEVQGFIDECTLRLLDSKKHDIPKNVVDYIINNYSEEEFEWKL